MNHLCPNCELDLAEKKPVSAPMKGERKLLPLRTALACPECGSRLQVHLHPVERNVRGFDALFLLILVLASVVLDDNRYFYLGVGVSGIAELALWIWSRRNLREWRRYALVG